MLKSLTAAMVAAAIAGALTVLSTGNAPLEAGPLAKPVNGRIHMRRPGQYRGMRVGRRQTEIIMCVHLDFEIRHRAQLTNQSMGRKRFQDADRVGETKTPGAAALRRLDNLFEKITVGT